MTKRFDVRPSGVLLLVLLLFAAAGPGRAQSSAVSPEIFRIDSWNVLAMDHSYLFLRDPGTGTSGLDVLAGVRTPDEPGYLRFWVFEDADPAGALSLLSEKGLLGNTDYEKAKELLAEQGYDSSGKEGKQRDLTADDLQKLEGDPGTTTIGKDFIDEAVKNLTALANGGPVFAKSTDCSFLSGVLYFAEQSRQAAEKAGEKTAGPLSSVLLTQFCASPAGVPAGAPPALPSPLPAIVPRPAGPIQPPVWVHDHCEGEEGNQRTCVDPNWQTCICTCNPDRVGGATWQGPTSCTGPTLWPLGPPATACSPAGGYAWCGPAPGSLCYCNPATTPPTFTPPPPPPPTPPPTTPPRTGSFEVAAAFAGLMLLAAWFVRRRSRA